MSGATVMLAWQFPAREQEQWQLWVTGFPSILVHSRADAGMSLGMHKSPGVSAQGQSSSLERAARNLFSFTLFSFHASR